jgi:hypothetical protein
MSPQHWHALLAELENARRQGHLLTYRSLIERLALPAPAMRTLTDALEQLAALDSHRGHPLRSALVISQGASRLPGAGFFQCITRLGHFPESGQATATVSWHAEEVARVFTFNYPQQHCPDTKPVQN